MENLNKEETESTFGVECRVEDGHIRLSGSSYPEYTVSFFKPLYEWIENYIADIGKDITLNLEVNYLNSSSSKCLLDLLEILENYTSDGGTVTINWYYEEDDEDALEAGHEFADDSEMPFNFLTLT